MFGKLFKCSIIAGLIFSASTASTAFVSQKVIENKKKGYDVDVPYEEEDSELEILDPIVITDTDKFISSLSSFGNLEGNLQIDINNKNDTYSIGADVFVSLESLEDLQLKADLNIKALGFDIDLSLSYLNSYVYLSAYNKNFKLNTNDISQFTSLLDYISLPFDTSMLSTLLSSFSTDDLLEKIGSMKSTKYDDYIEYKCTLIPFFPPIMFKSDLNYNLTNVSLTNVSIKDFKLNVNADINVLGLGKNIINVPESDSKHFVDLTSYIGTAKNVLQLINEPKLGFDYSLNISNEDESICSTGKIDFDISTMSGKILGNINDQTLGLNNNFEASYLDDILYFNLDNSIKLSYQKSSIEDLISIITSKVPNDSFNNVANELSSTITMPLINVINSKSYLDLLNFFDDIQFDEEFIKITIQNSLFGDSKGLILMQLDINNEGIKSLTISNLNLIGFNVDFKLNLRAFETIEVSDKNTYVSLDYINGVVDDIFNLVNEKKFGLDINLNLKQDDIKMFETSGSIDINLNDLAVAADLNLKLDSFNFDKNVVAKYLNSTIYFEYEDDIKLSYKESSIYDLLDIINSKIPDANVSNALDSLSTSLSLPLLDIIYSSNYLDLLSYFDAVTFDNNGINISFNNSLIGGRDSLCNVRLSYDENGLKGIDISNLTIMDFQLNLQIDYANYRKITVNEDDYAKLDNINGVVSKVINLVDDPRIALDYSVDIYKDNIQCFASEGDFKIDVNNLNAEFVGNIVNEDNNLNSLFSAKYIDDTVYFAYNDAIKIGYEKSSIENLINVLSQNLGNNELVSELSSTISSGISLPILDLIKAKDINGLLEIFPDLSFTSNSIKITTSNALLGGEDEELSLLINYDENGLVSIQIINLILLGYNVDATFALNTFTPIENVNKDDYSFINHADGLVNDIFSLIGERQFDLSLEGSLNIGEKLITLNGNTQFDIDNQTGTGILQIIDNANLEHNIDLDVYDNDNVYFSYNDNLHGTFKISSLMELVNSVMNLLQKDERWAPYFSGLVKEKTQSTIDKIKDGHLEAILYDNIIKSFKVINDNFILEINGSLISQNDPIIITINMDGKHLKGLSLDLSFNDIHIDITAAINEFTGYRSDRLDPNGEYIDFGNINALFNYFYKTSSLNDFELEGTLALTFKGNILPEIPLKDPTKISAQVKVLDDNCVLAHISLKNIPHIIVASEGYSWETRSLDMYVKTHVETGEAEIFMEKKVSGYKTSLFGNKTTYVETVRLNGEQFSNNLIYYLVSFGLGINESLVTESDTEKEEKSIDYSTILKDFEYEESDSIPSWEIIVNIADLLGISLFNDVLATIKGNADGYLSNITAAFGIQLLSLTIGATLNGNLVNIGQELDMSNYETFILTHQNYNYEQIYRNDF